MRILIGICVLSGCLAGQVPPTTSPSPAVKQTNKPTQKSTAPAPLTVPKDAVATTPGFYRWTDKDGKVWTYRKTPFGVKRWLADADPRPVVADKRDQWDRRTTAVEQGDSIRFELATPFGKRTWVRKKTELSESEQRIWDLQQKNNTASHTAASRPAEKE
jgi:hypothetical protein